MALIGMEKRENRYYPSYQFSADGELVQPMSSSTFEASLVLLLGECGREITCGTRRIPLQEGQLEGLTSDQVMVMRRIIDLYNEVVGYFPKR